MKYYNVHTHHPALDESKGIISYFSNHIPELVGNKISHYLSTGIHPWHISPCCFPLELKLMEGISGMKNFLAIGECGLDKLAETSWDLQNEVLIEQVKLSEKIHKPIIIHCVKAFQEILNIRNQLKCKQKWIFHGFQGNTLTALQLIQQDCYLSFGKALLENRPKTKEALQNIPLDKVFLETDAAEIHISDVYSVAAEIKKISMNQLQNQIENNFKLVFLCP